MGKAPHGYLCVTPYFTVADADGFMAFVAAVLDARVVKENRYPDGSIQHARLEIGDSLIMLNQATADYPPNTSQMHVYVDDVDVAYRLALEHGAVSLMAPMIRPHGDRMAGFTDPGGNVWWVAQAV